MRRFLAWLIVLLVFAGVAYAIWSRPSSAPQQAGRRRGGEAVPVLVATAQQQDVPIWFAGLGTVQAFNTVTVRPMIDGPLVEIRFREGQDVKPGDVLARIDARPYQAALDQAAAKKAQDEANLANARLDLARYVKLAQTNYTTQQQADTQRSTVAQLEAQVRQDQAAIDTARTNLSYTTITSPIEGRTGIRQVDIGNIIHTSDTNGLVVITQLHPISVTFTLPQQNLDAVRSAEAQGPVTVQALPQGALAPPSPPAAAPGADTQTAADPPPPPTVLDTGTLTVLDNQVDSSTGTIKLKAAFPNPDLKLWPGGFVNARLLARTERGVTTVPPAAVQLGPNGAYVYVISDEKAARRNVTIGYQDEQLAIVTAGVTPGETVVTDGASRLTDGATVHVAQPNPPASAQGQSPAQHRHRRQGNAS